MMSGLAQRLAQQGPQRPMQHGEPPQQGAGRPQWGGPGMGNGWLQPALQRMGQALGAQAWGQPGQGAPTIAPPRPGANPDLGARAQQTQGMAQRYAQGAQQAQGIVNDEDPRFNGMR